MIKKLMIEICRKRQHNNEKVAQNNTSDINNALIIFEFVY
jgi:hypothetical protein